jgi:aspartyl-tRNA(Asn)/glutamyl-tRNA(Gln) amidotransferase subunit B
VIGLEVHVQLRTRSKLFCACRAEYGARPNSLLCEVCYGLPGALPVLNRRAVELAVRTASALDFEVREVSAFNRKHYFYPDLPKGYQITQHERPLAVDGALTFRAPHGFRTVALRRLHLEEDSGRSLHRAGEGKTALDFNRAGVPLVEIVTAPELATPAEARTFLLALKRVLEYLAVSDCNMEEGSLRVDANVSLRADDGEAGERTEIKNLNSFSGVERALAFEIERQRAEWSSGSRPARGTRLWHPSAAVTRELRDKEDTEDYRYIAEPDLPLLMVSQEVTDEARRSLPELPSRRVERLVEQCGVSPEQAEVLASSRALADRFEAVVAAGVGAGIAASWLLGEDRGMAGAAGPSSALEREALIGLLTLLDRGDLTRAQAREIAAEMQATGKGAGELAAERGTGRVTNPDRLEAWARTVIGDQPAELERYRAGDLRLLDFFVGRAMALSRGSADPRMLVRTVRRLLDG